MGERSLGFGDLVTGLVFPVGWAGRVVTGAVFWLRLVTGSEPAWVVLAEPAAVEPVLTEPGLAGPAAAGPALAEWVPDELVPDELVPAELVGVEPVRAGVPEVWMDGVSPVPG